MRIGVGIDAAEQTRWACAVDERGRVVLDRAVENNPRAIDDFVDALREIEGEVVIGLDVVGSFARFLQASLPAEGFALVQAPGIAVDRAGRSFAGGELESDPEDARTIAELVRTREPRPVATDEETVVAIRLEVGRRRELMTDRARRLSRLRGLLCGIHPSLERARDVTCKAPPARLTRCVIPAEMRRAGKLRLVAHLRKTHHLHRVEALAERALAAARARRLAVPGEAPASEPIRELADEVPHARDRIARIDHDLEGLRADHPDGSLVRSLPGMGATRRAEFIACVGDVRRFASADAMASAAGLAPVLRQSGRSAAWRRAFGGDKALKRVFVQSAFCAVAAGEPLSRAFYERKRREGQHRTQALIALARRRVTVLWAMLRSGKSFDPNRKVA